MLSSELVTLISDRCVEIELVPFVFSEYCKISKAKTFQKSNSDLFKEYAMFGGMPGIHHMEWKDEYIYQYLSSIFDSIVLNDIIKRNKIRNPSFLELIIKFVFQNIGNIFLQKVS